MSYADIRNTLAGDIRRGAVALEEGAIARYLGSRDGAGMTASEAKETAARFLRDLRAAQNRASAGKSGRA